MFGESKPKRSREVKEAVEAEGGVLAGRTQATIEMIRKHEAALRRTARRYSLCAEDADDAYQRALEIALTKAPTDRPGELIRWTQTVTKHEALAIRRNRERLLGNRPSAGREDETVDWLSLIPAPDGGPGNRVERREAIARSREALRSLKPAELRALTLLAEGYSYAEISSITGFSATKVNRCLAEGRERFRAFLARSEAGDRCREIGPLLSAFCDGELDDGRAEEVREHLRACAGCRAAARSYRAAPGAAAALSPAILASRSVLERLQDGMAWLHSRLPGGPGESAVAQVASAGGAPGAGLTALAKVLAVCAGAAGGTAACLVAGVAPAPMGIAATDERPAQIERVAKGILPVPVSAQSHGPARNDASSDPEHGPSDAPAPEPAPAPSAPPPTTEVGAVEYEPTPAPEPAPETEPAPAPEPVSEGGSAAGEFGP